MKHRLTSLALRLWLCRRIDDDYLRRIALANVRADIRHTLNQGHHDYKRRGFTNREGLRNRRWRRYWADSAENRKGTIVWPDYAL